MASTIQFKRSSVAGKIPDSANVSVGEPVVNLSDQTLYTKNGSGDIIVIGSGKLGNLSDVSNSSPSFGQVLTWNGSLWAPAESTGSDPATAANTVLGVMVQDAFQANGTGTTFVLSSIASNANTIIVFVDSVIQEPITNYNVSGNVLTFTAAPVNNANVDVRYFKQDAFDLALGELNNVSNTNPLTGQALIWSGSEWAPSNVSTDANVISVNGYTGVVSLDTDDITEATNLYFTDTRARDAISVSGAGSYDNTTGVITITGGVTSVAGAEGAISNVQLADGIIDTGILTTANITEDTNLYYTDARVYSNVTQLGYITATSLDGYATNSQLSDYATVSFAGAVYDAANTAQTTAEAAFDVANAAVVADDLTTANVTELNNLYYTDARVYSNVTSYLSGNVSVGDLTVAGNLVVQGDTTTLNTTTLTVEDLNVVLAAGAPDAAAADGAGISIDGALANIIYSEANDWFDVNKSINISDTYGKVFFNSADAYVGVEPGIEQVILSGAANQSVKIITDNDISGNGLYWLFNVSGNLTAPGDIITSSNVNVGNVNITDGQLIIHGVYDYTLNEGDGGLYLNSPYSITLQSNTSGDPHLWIFNENGTLIAPGDIIGNISSLANHTTSNVIEGSNLYYTDARVYSNVTQLGYITATSLDGYATNSQLADYATVSLTGTVFDAANTAQLTAEAAFDVANAAVVSDDLTTANVTEDTNLYYTDARVYANVSLATVSTLADISGNVPVAGQALVWDSNVNLWAPGNVAASSSSSSTLALYARYEFTASASQTSFSGNDDNSKLLYITNPEYTEVYLNGIRIVPDVDYTANTSHIVLTEAAAENDNLSVIRFVDAAADFTADQFTGDGTTGEFTLSQIPSNKAAILITFNGIRQHTSEYSLSNTTLTFNSAPGYGELIEVVHLGAAQAQSNVAQSSWLQVSSNVTVSTLYKYMVDTTGGSITLTLPDTPSLGDTICVLDGTGNFGTSNVLISRNSSNIMGQADDLYLDVDNSYTELVYFNATYGWRVIS